MGDPRLIQVHTSSTEFGMDLQLDSVLGEEWSQDPMSLFNRGRQVARRKIQSRLDGSRMADIDEIRHELIQPGAVFLGCPGPLMLSRTQCPSLSRKQKAKIP